MKGVWGMVCFFAHLLMCAPNGVDLQFWVLGLVWPVGSTVLPVALATPVT